MFIISLKRVLNNLQVKILFKYLVYKTLTPNSLNKVTILKKVVLINQLKHVTNTVITFYIALIKPTFNFNRYNFLLIKSC